MLADSEMHGYERELLMVYRLRNVLTGHICNAIQNVVVGRLDNSARAPAITNGQTERNKIP